MFFLSDVSRGLRSNGPAAAAAADSHGAVGAVGVGGDSQPHHPDRLCTAHASPAQLHQPAPASTHGHIEPKVYTPMTGTPPSVNIHISVCCYSVNHCTLKHKEMKEENRADKLAGP